MATTLLRSIVSASLPDHCEPSSPWLTAISSHLHICLPTPLALISSVLGTLSIVSWLFAQLPQIYKNYQLQSTSGLSIFFLVIWCAGDASNLLGAWFTRQAGWQVVVAGYYVCVDVVLVIQFFWYTHYKSKQYMDIDDYAHDHRHGQSEYLDGVSLSGDEMPRQSPAPVNVAQKRKTEVHDMGVQTGSTPNSALGRTPPFAFAGEKANSPRRSGRMISTSASPPFALPRTMLIASLVCAVLANASPTHTAPSPLPHPPISDAPRETVVEVFGRVFSWMSTILYLGSRPPQLYKNYCRKSTEGLSPLLFMAAFFGNLFYSSSLVTNPNFWSDFPPYGGGGWADGHGNDRLEWIGRASPFFLGAFGVLGLDGFMGVQFLMYGSSDLDDESIVSANNEDVKRGRGRWRRVQGWMRGWIPSASPARNEHGHRSLSRRRERQALLSSERDHYGAV
ncbi:hypothetical protein N7539_002662 [Penicillium diatomitis]|uniref:PQ loop repeat protein n=1 Tax=Penicillium diatomitis TaxID=2819901 RepID=A0A9X0BYV0_9EURO|nr:uncharacterized protein N7539_002662 [Penicillium diatomitis]KAJ5491095.1 hypothetical protein N7539_002662 [Penicillium diatomitis]